MIWRDRKLKIEDGILCISRVGHHDDFAYYDARVPAEERAFAMTGPGVGGPALIWKIVPVCEHAVILLTNQGPFLMSYAHGDSLPTVTRIEA